MELEEWGSSLSSICFSEEKDNLAYKQWKRTESVRLSRKDFLSQESIHYVKSETFGSSDRWLIRRYPFFNVEYTHTREHEQNNVVFSSAP